MSIFEDAIKAYDALKVGEYEENKEPLCPICHITTSVDIQITLDERGNFMSAEKCDKSKVIIPATEESMSRSNGKCAHPLIDNLEYISANYDEEKHSLYLKELKDWVNSPYRDEKLYAIYNYVVNSNVVDDIMFLFENKDENKIRKQKVSWSVDGLGDRSGRVVEDKILQNKWIDYYTAKISERKKNLSMISGEEGIPATSHLKGIYSLAGNAKIISSNTKEYFNGIDWGKSEKNTFSIGFVESQKAHNLFKYMISNYRAKGINDALICWELKEDTCDVYDILQPISEKEEFVPRNEDISNLIKGKNATLNNVIIIRFSIATTGRLSVTYYDKMPHTRFMEKMNKWNKECSFQEFTPSLNEIVWHAYSRNNNLDDGIKKHEIRRLLETKLKDRNFPLEIMQNAVNKAKHLEIVKDGNFLPTVCSIIRKYKIDTQKEDIGMTLDVNKNDRSYQFGRLMAILEKIEKDITKGKRESNIIRRQSAYIRHPLEIFGDVMEKIKTAYYPKLSEGGRVRYENMIEQIMSVVSGEDMNKPLNENYIVGYYLQKNELYKKSEEK